MGWGTYLFCDVPRALVDESIASAHRASGVTLEPLSDARGVEVMSAFKGVACVGVLVVEADGARIFELLSRAISDMFDSLHFDSFNVL